MRRRRRLILLLITLVPVALLFIAAVIYVRVQVGKVTARLDRILIAELKQRLERDVRISRVTSEPLGRLVIYDLAISDGPTFAAGTLLTAKRVEISYRWMDLVLGKVPPVQSVTLVRLIEPGVVINRKTSGSWNVLDIFKPQGPRRPPFIGNIDVVNGRVVIRDFLGGPPGARPAVNRLSKINGNVDLSHQPVITFAAALSGDHFTTGEVSGRYNSKRKSIDINVAAKGGDAAYWAAYKPFLNPIHIQRGRFDARLYVARTITATRQAKWSYLGSGQLKDVRATVPQLAVPLENVAGKVEFANELVTIDLRGAAAGSLLNAKGAITIAPRKNIRIALRSTSLNFSRLARAVRAPGQLAQARLEGIGSANLLLVGWPPGIAVRGTAHIPRADAAGYQASNIDITGSYAGRVVNLTSASVSALGGRISARGSVDLRGGTYRLALSGTARNVRLQSAPPIRRLGLYGIADGRFTLTGTTAHPVAVANVKVTRGNLRNIAFSRATGTVQLASGRVVLQDLTASASGGIIRASGVVTTARMDLRLSALGVDAGRLLRSFGYKEYEGKAYFSGRIGGPATNPTVVGNIEIFNGRAGPLTFEHARGHIAGNKTAIALTETTIRRDSTQATVSGRILGLTSGKPRLELQLDVKDVVVEDLAKSLNIPIPATGKVSGTFSVTGTAANPSIAGNFSLTNGSVMGYEITSASGEISYSAGKVGLTNLAAEVNGAALSASGSATTKGELSGWFSVKNVPLSALNESLKPYMTLSGSANMSGTIEGTIIAPRIGMSVAAPNMVLNGEKFSDLQASATYDGVTAALTNASLTADGETYRISSFAYNLEENYVALTASVENGQIERLFKMVTRSAYLSTPEGDKLRSIIQKMPQPVKGSINGTVTASGPLDKLKGQFQVSALNATVGEQRIDSVELNISSDQGHVKLDKFAAISGDLNLNASGDILKNDRLNLNIEAYNVDLKLLQPWTGIQDVTGIATIIAVIEGPILQPTIQASAEIVSPTIRGFALDHIRASQILVSRNQLELSDVIFTKGSYRGLLVGTLPWDWETLTVPFDQPLSLHAELDKQSLAILSALTPAVLADGTSGTIDANLDIAGTASLPDLTGNLVITDGAINMRAFNAVPPQGPSDFKNIQARMTFMQGDISIETFKGTSSRGGDFTASGTIGLSNFPNGPVNLKFSTDKMVLSEQNLSGNYNESVAAKLTTALTVTGPVKEPLVAGHITATDAQVKIPAVKQEAKPKPFGFPIDPRFNITATAGSNVWVYNPRLAAMIRGGGSLSGSLSSPLIRATMTVQRGNIRLPTARPELRRGGTISVVYAPPEPARAILDLEATTSVTSRSNVGFLRRYDIVLNVRGPLDNLAIDARSQPPGLTRDQIFALIGRVPGVLVPGQIVVEQELADIFTATIVPEVFSPLENAFVQAFGLEQFRLEVGAQSPVSLYLSKNLFRNLYVSYWRTFTAGQEQFRASLSYRLTDRLQLSAVATEQPEMIFEIEGTQRF